MVLRWWSVPPCAKEFPQSQIRLRIVHHATVCIQTLSDDRDNFGVAFRHGISHPGASVHVQGIIFVACSGVVAEASVMPDFTV
jgi:hypothetical protein